MVQCTRALAHARASSRGVNLPIGGSIHTLVPMDRGSKYLWRVGPGVQIPGGSNYTPTPVFRNYMQAKIKGHEIDLEWLKMRYDVTWTILNAVLI